MATLAEREAMLGEIAAQVRVCRLCDLSRSRTHAVPGEGPVGARVFLVGEGPGYHEDQQGRPFVGAAGKFLDTLLGEAGLRREEVFITNIVKCRPPGNRDPQPDEIEACHDYLLGQIAIVQPQVVLTLGRHAMGALIERGLSITRVHGQVYTKSGLTFIPLFHPAAALHREELREVMLADMRALRGVLARLGLQGG